MQKAFVKFKALSQLTKNGFNTNSKIKFKRNIEKTPYCMLLTCLSWSKQNVTKTQEMLMLQC